jgi:hypothetical protein
MSDYWLGQTMLLVASTGFVITGIAGRAFYRSRLGGPDPHPARIRFALVAIGLAMLLLFVSQLVSPK